MAIHEIIRMGHPTLRKTAEQVTLEEIKSSEMKQLIQDMVETMEDYSGVGLAAPQINISKQIAIIKLPEESDRYEETEISPLYVLFNPKITILSEQKQGCWEGCLSVPDLRGFVERPEKIKVNYLNELGEKSEIQLEGFLATVFQHELDHLDGILYIDKLKDTKLLSYCAEFDEFFTEE